MKVAACQLPEIRKDFRAALALAHEHARVAAGAGARLVCFPECFLQGYDSRPAYVAGAAIDLAGAAFAQVLKCFETLEPVIVVGVIERSGDSLYNSAVAIKLGKVIGRYRKMHLLPGERSVFEPGTEPTVFDIDGTTVGINICYDLNFGESIERCVRAGASVLVCPCSNMMQRAMAEDWKPRHNEIRSRQAKDHKVWIVSADIVGERDDRVSYGPTAVIDPTGVVIAQVPLLSTGMVVAEIN